MTYERFEELFDELPLGKKIEMYNNYCYENRGGEGVISLFDEEFFDTNFSSPMDAARAVHFGNIEDWNDDYIRFNAYGNLVSLTEYDAEDIINDYKEEIFDNPNIWKDDIEDEDDEDEEEEDDEEEDEEE